MTSLRIALCQMRVYPGEPARNAGFMLETIAAWRGRADVLVFPELCVPGYFLGDGWERAAFLRDCELWNARLIAATGAHDDSPAIVFGTVAVDWGARGEDGRPRKFNAWVAAAGGTAAVNPGLGTPYGVKTLLPHYREFEDGRHFYDARELARDADRPWEDFVAPVTLAVAGRTLRLGVLLCEDAWEDDYVQKPVAALAAKKPDLVVNLSASPFTRGKNGKRNRVFSDKARALGCPLLYVNCTGIQNNGKTLYTFDGRSAAYGGDGRVLETLTPYEEGMTLLEVESGVGCRVSGVKSENEAGAGVSPDSRLPTPDSITEITAALRYGAREFLSSTGLGKVVIGVSGGIDSAVSAALFASFLPPENILLVNMPSRYNSTTTRELASRLAANLGCLYAEVPIEDSLNVARGQLHGLYAASADGRHGLKLALEGLADENAQARDRGARVLAGLAQSFGGVFVCNANKAELTVGYGTLYGDIAGFLAPLGDLWKHEVYAVGRYLNEAVYGRDVIPEGVFTIVPSAELGVHHAVDEGKGDPLHYPYHDRLFFAFVQRWQRVTPEDVLEWYAAGTLAAELGLPAEVDLAALFPTPAAFIADLEKWWGLYNGIGVAKRVQAPPVLAVSSRAFGFDHREALGRAVYTEHYKEIKTRLLEGRG